MQKYTIKKLIWEDTSTKRVQHFRCRFICGYFWIHKNNKTNDWEFEWDIETYKGNDTGIEYSFKSKEEVEKRAEQFYLQLIEEVLDKVD